MLKTSILLLAVTACLAIPVDQAPPAQDPQPVEYDGVPPPPPGAVAQGPPPPGVIAQGPPPTGVIAQGPPPPGAIAQGPGAVPPGKGEQKPEGSDLKTDSSHWWGYQPYYRTYSYYTPTYYSYYTPYYHNYHKSYYWW